jgi:hypothetical protein
VLCVPDFVANAGGVICAAAEYRRGTRAQALSLIEERIRANTLEVLTRVREQDVLPREAAETLAWERVQEARSYRRYPWPRTRATTGGTGTVISPVGRDARRVRRLVRQHDPPRCWSWRCTDERLLTGTDGARRLEMSAEAAAP